MQGLLQSELPLVQRVERAKQIVLALAANAAIGQLEQILVPASDKVAVDTDLAELVDNHCDTPAGRIAQQAVQQRRFPRTKKTGQQRDGNPAVTSRFGLRHIFPIDRVWVDESLRVRLIEDGPRAHRRATAIVDSQWRPVKHELALA